MIKQLKETKQSLKAIEMSLGAAQKLSTEMQTSLKGGGEDQRRPPVVAASIVVLAKLI